MAQPLLLLAGAAPASALPEAGGVSGAGVSEPEVAPPLPVAGPPAVPSPLPSRPGVSNPFTHILAGGAPASAGGAGRATLEPGAGAGPPLTGVLGESAHFQGAGQSESVLQVVAVGWQ
jgi:hypothetical protein